MILPESLRPLPVTPNGDEPAVSVPFEDFVAVTEVRKVLLGAGEFPVEGLPAEDFDCFAGRADIPFPSRTAPKADVPVELPIPDMALENPVVHPAFEVLPPSARRAAPPKLRQAVDCEASYGRSRVSERWWVIGMGLAACAVLFSGTLVDFIARGHAPQPRGELHLPESPARSRACRGLRPSHRGKARLPRRHRRAGRRVIAPNPCSGGFTRRESLLISRPQPLKERWLSSV